MLPSDPAAPSPAPPAALVEEYRRGAAMLAAAIAAGALAALLGATVGQVSGLGSPAALLGVTLAAFAILLLSPAAGAARRWPRAAGRLLALALLALVAAWAGGWLPPLLDRLPIVWGPCFLLLAASLLLKPRWPRTAVGADLLVWVTGYVVLLDCVTNGENLQTPAQAGVHLMVALGMVLVPVAWMFTFPSQRPIGYFLEPGSAGTILRRVLPFTLLLPVLLVTLSSVPGRAHGVAGQVAAWTWLLSLVAFIVALIWIIAASLDRLDAVHQAAERDLRLSEQCHRLLFENNPVPMWAYDARSQRFLVVNHSAVRAYGYTLEEFLARSLPDLAAPGDDPRGEVRRLRTAGGQVLEVEVFAQPADWKGLAAEVAFLHDVTAKRQAEARLRDSEAQVRVLLDSTQEGVLAVDAEGRCAWCNPAAVRLLGLSSAAELLGEDIHARFHHSHPDGSPFPAEQCPMVQAVRQGRVCAYHEQTLWRADGTNFPADYRSAPLLRDGRIVGAVVSFADVSEHRSLQAQFHQAQKMEAVGRLAAGIAHDFNNLLTVINGYTALLLRAPNDAAWPEKLGQVHRAGERAAALTQQLLAFSRQQTAQPQWLDLNAVLAEMDPLLRRILGEDLEIAIHLAPELATVRADPGQIGQVLMNLVVNARDAMPGGGRLTLETANVDLDAHYAALHPEVTPGPYVMLAVTDNGAGMDAATLACIFDPFFTTKPAGQGTGLGLATVAGIVQQSGGSIAVYSEVGRGTAMKVYLPAFAHAPAAAAAVPAPAPVPDSGATLLIVEDEESVRQLAGEVLADAGFTVHAAATPYEALALSHRLPTPLDLLITDVVLPSLDGRRLAEQLLQQHPTLPVLFISGYPDHAVALNLEPSRTWAFLAKPFTPDALVGRVRTLLASRAARAASA